MNVTNGKNFYSDYDKTIPATLINLFIKYRSLL